ncbi:MAG: class I SAM-dependent methyltransferase [Kofleriaceae bacterium]|nr:class I SAM-dependent methyltransferase [Myxococcales bacterium]MCB9574084.1 class I SAM-dependent methyltransferase [Kofleriaceae bacterium]
MKLPWLGDVSDLRELRRRLRGRVELTVRRTWMKYALRGVGQADAHRRLDLAYKVRDPWKMESKQEQFRFAETSRLLHRHLIAPAERVGRILEIGCGEGHQTEHLVPLCDRVTGIDVSPTAVERARGRVPGVDFAAGDLFAQPWIDERDRFDVVTAFEVLYYLKDIPRTLEAMNRLGKACMVTYFAPAARVVEMHVMGMPGAARETFRYGDTEWVAVWWRSPR